MSSDTGVMSGWYCLIGSINGGGVVIIWKFLLINARVFNSTSIRLCRMYDCEGSKNYQYLFVVVMWSNKRKVMCRFCAVLEQLLYFFTVLLTVFAVRSNRKVLPSFIVFLLLENWFLDCLISHVLCFHN